MDTPILTLGFSLIVGFVTHYLTKDRDARTRKSILDREADLRRRQFRKVLFTFRGQMERVEHTPSFAAWTKFVELAPAFKGEAALVRGDFPDEPTFAKLVDTLGGWPHEEVEKAARAQGTNLRQVICDSIDELIKFTEAPSQSTTAQLNQGATA